MVVLRRRRQIRIRISTTTAIPAMTHGAKLTLVDSFSADSPVPGFAGPVEAVSPGEGVGDVPVTAHPAAEGAAPSCATTGTAPAEGEAWAAPSENAGVAMSKSARKADLRIVRMLFSFRGSGLGAGVVMGFCDGFGLG